MAFRLILNATAQAQAVVFISEKQVHSGGNLIDLSPPELGVWTFIAFTYDGTNSIGYIDSVSENESTGGTTEFNLFRIGRNRNGNTFFTWSNR